VKKKLKKKARRQIHKALDSGVALPESELEYAQRLLEGRDPAHVVATLIQRTQTECSTEPREVGVAKANPRLQNGDLRKYEQRGYRHTNRGGGENTRFTINWGFQGGANAKRLLAHICRRGQITGAQVGQIRVDARMASFEVEGGVAREFETRVQGRDARDPKLFIRRDSGRPARAYARS